TGQFTRTGDDRVISTAVPYGAGGVRTFHYYAFGDFDGDGTGTLDFIGSIGNDDEVHVLTQVASKWTGDAKITFPAAVLVTGMARGDVNGDGRPDVIVASGGANPGLYLLLRNTSATAPYFTVSALPAIGGGGAVDGGAPDGGTGDTLADVRAL